MRTLPTFRGRSTAIKLTNKRRAKVSRLLSLNEGQPSGWPARVTKRGIGFEPLDNGILRCADPEAMQRLADGLTAARIDALLRCARLTGEGQPVEVRRKEGVTNHFRPESCAGRCEAAGEALTGARTGRAIEHRKRERLERRDCHSGRRQHRHHRNGEGMAGSTVSENPCTFVRPSSGPGMSSFCPGSRTGAAAGRRIPYPMMPRNEEVG